jgi:hypothetical protein
MSDMLSYKSNASNEAKIRDTEKKRIFGCHRDEDPVNREYHLMNFTVCKLHPLLTVSKSRSLRWIYGVNKEYILFLLLKTVTKRGCLSHLAIC